MKTLLEIFEHELINEPDILNMTKRFKIVDPSGRTENSRYDTIKEIIADLQSNKRDLSLQSYYVEDLEDDMEITADELLQAWDEGERPEDLQMF
jgi:hypothetical protein